jgi:septum formation protein
MIERTLYLASKSPRRSQLLKESGIPFHQLSVDVEETYPQNLQAGQVASYLAQLKANAAKTQFPECRPLLTADSIVILNDEILEKPKNAEEAQTMLQKLSGKHHFVDTGFCIINEQDESLVKTVRSEVVMGTLSPQEIQYYITHYHPFDKAGSYGIQEWIGHCKIERISGSYTNIMGLPMYEVYEALRQMM